MADKLVNIPNDYTQNYTFCRFQSVQWLKRLETELNEPTNRNSSKVPKVINPLNEKRYHKVFGTSVTNSPI